jgi:hypothetical protein
MIRMLDALKNYTLSLATNLRILIFAAIAIVAIWIAAAILRALLNWLIHIGRMLFSRFTLLLIMLKMNALGGSILRAKNAEQRSKLIRTNNACSDRYELVVKKTCERKVYRLRLIGFIKWIATLLLIAAAVSGFYIDQFGIHWRVVDIYMAIEKALIP